MYFAFEKTTRASILDVMLPRLSAETGNGSSWWALVDLAFDHGGVRLQWHRESVSLYQTGALAQLHPVSPTLMKLGLVAEEAKSDLTTLALHCGARPMLSFVQVPGPIEDLVAAWQACIYPATDDGQKFLLRLADTRVIPTLPLALSPAHWARVVQPLVEWQAPGRDGLIYPVPLAAKSFSGMASDTEITLADVEVDRLIHHAMPDTLIEAMREHCPDLLPATGHGAFYREVSRAHDVAARCGVQAFPDLVALAVACVLQPGLVDDERLVARLTDGTWRPGELNDKLMELMPEETA
ncbi:DUF4123 domain-containing protein [Caldimonas brevitalea]|uniref:DUF4123 domain-containing protein n=1 Tax=Caldimonas brevitalea TaxID=413882 RepID=A0A0G3BHU1_9BURK|nr:DUF4123 domain-containing protein [Caldimonas brevitalea]AKJ27553.1 hypothetical protein AAW51_0862 [Caldimonas brevitalea]